MNRHSIITTKFPYVVLAAAAMAAAAFAHEGFEHVMGTVVNIENSVLTIKTATGDVNVKLDAKTEITKDDQKAAVGDLSMGLRVVVDLPEGGKGAAAHSVKIGVAEAATEHADHDEHKESHK